MGTRQCSVLCHTYRNLFYNGSIVRNDHYPLSCFNNVNLASFKGETQHCWKSMGNTSVLLFVVADRPWDN